MKTPFVVATPARSVCDDQARVLHSLGQLRRLLLGTRRGTRGVPPEQTRLLPAWGLAAYVGARLLSTYHGEAFRYALHPWFDGWVRRQLLPGDHLISSYGYTPGSFRWVQAHGGRTWLDGGNSHLQNFWDLMQEEHRRWRSPYPPFSPRWLRQGLRTLEHTDFVFTPSRWVADSFLARGFRPEQLLPLRYPVDLACFTPATEPRPPERPLTVISTGQLSLRKGTPYLLEAFRLVLRQEPGARLLLTEAIANTARPILAQYADLPIDWAPSLPHAQLAERLRGADVFVLPSLEEGMARTVAEAMACGLPVVVTQATGTADLVEPGVSGTVVPPRDPAAIAEGILHWGAVARARVGPPERRFAAELLSFEHYARELQGHLARLGFA